MPVFIIFIIWLLAATSEARALRRNVCDFVGAEPILYHEYGASECPPINQLLPDGQCRMSPYTSPPCGAFCQVRTSFRFGQEQPYPGDIAYCHGPMTCTITDTVTTTWTGSLNIPVSASFAGSFTAGITGGASYASARARARGSAVTLKENECGYFTFLPILKDVCGTWTQGHSVDGAFSTSYCIGNETTGNMCLSVLQHDKDATTSNDDFARGDTVFVKADCGTHQPLPMDQQDPAYRHDGVALPRAVYDAYAHVFSQIDKGVISTKNSPTCGIDSSSPMVQDCIHAMFELTRFPGSLALHGKKSGKWWSTYVQSCAVEIEYAQDWDSSCDVNLAEVFSVAGRILDTCADNNPAKVSGSLPLRNDGKCNSNVSITSTTGRNPPQGQ